jgi:hypothetical protein
MASRISRRMFLLGCGGGAASASLAWAAWSWHDWARAGAGGYPLPSCCGYVEYSGWILTKVDKDRLTAEGAVRVLDNTSLGGRDLADGTVDNVEACSAWCVGDPDCQGFTFAKATHPDPHMQNRCWLKRSGDLSPVADPRFTSGLR